ncbi:photosystem reaction center protein H [Anoxybacter fermentans]|uniref:Photosystem reaction center protein H n=1 Tax=Anoxybacter fermentans TaxID=1323375 RepID=A0A3Q9HPV5_9FIRM|nr:YlmC/YmxH family sporulation protein [Anoxybacter fermentans]AZR73026.1 photosystem reaction center protein H [Anoxybacter fermentans]
MIKTSELWSKEVINVVDGRKLGMIEDVEINLKVGKIDSVIIPGRSGLLGFFGGTQDLVIEWNQIEKIGEDVILVKVENFLEPDHQKRQNR